MRKIWVKVGSKKDFPVNMGGCFLYLDEQIAVFNINHKKWYAVQNRCPHEDKMVLSRGLMGDSNYEPRVACPLHKRKFSLKTGKYMGDGECGNLRTYPVKNKNGLIFILVDR